MLPGLAAQGKFPHGRPGRFLGHCLRFIEQGFDGRLRQLEDRSAVVAAPMDPIEDEPCLERPDIADVLAEAADQAPGITEFRTLR